MQSSGKNLSRREFLTITAAGAASAAIAERLFSSKVRGSNIKEMLLYIGTYTSGKSKSEGIYIFRFDLESGKLNSFKTVANVVEPSFIAIEINRRFLYAVNETEEYQGQKSGAVSAFAIDQKSGDLKFLNKQPSLGGAPCYITTTNDSKFALTANYLGGNVAVHPLKSNGKLGDSTDSVTHIGTGPNKARQEAAHAHSVVLDRNNRFAVVCDLGIDRLMIYRFDPKTGDLAPNLTYPFVKTAAGAGPRHFVFHPDGKSAFVINELNSTVTSYDYDEELGKLAERDTVPTLPPDFRGENTCADIHISPDGRFLFGSNRGHDSIVSYRIDNKDRKPEPIEHVSTGGKKPRNFAIDPTGKYLLAANQDSDSIVVFSIDAETGRLTEISRAEVPTPVCLKLIPVF